MPETLVAQAIDPPERAPVTPAVTTHAGAGLPAARVLLQLPGQGRTAALSAATVAVLLAAWWFSTQAGWIKPLFLPRPEAVWRVFSDYALGRANDASLLTHGLASLGRVVAAFTLAVLTAVPLGLAMGLSRRVRGIADPVLEFYRPLPPLAYLPLVIIWFGIDETPKVLLIYLSCFAPLALAARAGTRNATLEQLQAAAAMGASRAQLLRHVVLPAALPDILTGLRIALGFGWTTLVAAEMVAAQMGLGQMVLNASNFLRTDIVVMGIVVIGAIAWAFDLAMRWLERRWVPWRGRA